MTKSENSQKMKKIIDNGKIRNFSENEENRRQ